MEKRRWEAYSLQNKRLTQEMLTAGKSLKTKKQPSYDSRLCFTYTIP